MRGFTGAAGVHVLGPLLDARGQMPSPAPGGGFSFTPIRPSARDELVLPPEFAHDVVAPWGDRLPGTNARVGYNADYTALIPTAPDGNERGALREPRVPEPPDRSIYIYIAFTPNATAPGHLFPNTSGEIWRI